MTDAPAGISALREILSRFPGRRVAVVGDLLVDEYLYANATRLSREAPIPVLELARERLFPGGGANVAVNVASLGGRVLPIGLLGLDAGGEALARLFAEAGIETAGLVRHRRASTIVKTRILGGGKEYPAEQHLLRLDRVRPYGGDVPEIDRALLACLENALENAEAVIAADYGYGTVTPRVIERLRRAAAEGVPVAVDSRYRFREFTGFAALLPNEAEAGVLAAELGVAADDLEGLRKALDCFCLVITRSREGIVWRTSAATGAVAAYRPGRALNVSGAGDSLMAAFALALAAGADFGQAAVLGNLAGGLAVAEPDIVAVQYARLSGALEDEAAPVIG